MLAIWIGTARPAVGQTDNSPQTAMMCIDIDENGAGTIYFWSEHGDDDLTDVERNLWKTLGGPIEPPISNAVTDDGWTPIGRFNGFNHHDGLVSCYFDTPSLDPSLQRLHVYKLTVDVVVNNTPFQRFVGATLLPHRQNGSRDYRWELRIGPQYNAFGFGYGYQPIDIAKMLLPYLLVLALPIVVILAARKHALRAIREGNVETAAVWFGYARLLQWLPTATLMSWIALTIAHPAFKMLILIAGSPDFERYGLSSLFMFIPLLVPAVLMSISHPVYATVRGIHIAREDLVRYGLLSQTRFVFILCCATGGVYLFTNPHIGVLWFLTGLVVLLGAQASTPSPLNVRPHALTSGDLRDRVFTLADGAGVTVKQVFLALAAKSQMANAFAAVGGNVIVTDILIDRLSRREVDAVLAHELTHLKRRHPQALLVASLSIIAVLPIFALGLHFGQKAIATVFLVSSIGSTLLVLGLSRRFEWAADAGSVAITKDPEAMITALIRISSLNMTPMDWLLPGRGKRTEASSAWRGRSQRTLGLVQAGTVTHPTTIARVKALASDNNIDDARLAELLTAPASLDRYPIPAGASEDRVFNSMAKGALSWQLYWVRNFSVVFIAAAFAHYAASLSDGGLAIAVLALGLPVSIVVPQYLCDLVGLRMYRRFDRAIRSRFRAQHHMEPGEMFFTAMSPSAHLRVYEGFYDWDVGLIGIRDGRLYYHGEQASFNIAPSSVSGVEFLVDRRGPSRWPRIRLRINVDESGETGIWTITLRPEPATLLPRARKESRRLYDAIAAWHVAGAGAPAEPITRPVGSVTSTSVGKAVTPPMTITMTVVAVACALAASVLVNVPFRGQVAGAGYVVLAAVAGVAAGVIPILSAERSTSRKNALPKKVTTT